MHKTAAPDVHLLQGEFESGKQRAGAQRRHEGSFRCYRPCCRRISCCHRSESTYRRSKRGRYSPYTASMRSSRIAGLWQFWSSSPPRGKSTSSARVFVDVMRACNTSNACGRYMRFGLGPRFSYPFFGIVTAPTRARRCCYLRATRIRTVPQRSKLLPAQRIALDPSTLAGNLARPPPGNVVHVLKGLLEGLCRKSRSRRRRRRCAPVQSATIAVFWRFPLVVRLFASDRQWLVGEAML